MAKVQTGRRTPVIPEQGAVVFLIGMRINRLWSFWKWAPVTTQMGRMISELMRHPELGLKGRPRTFVSGRTILVWQVWESFEKLEKYARSSDHAHMPAWSAFNRLLADNNSVGIYHETYLVNSSTAEAIYVNMTPLGLGNAFGLQPAEGDLRTAAKRLGR